MASIATENRRACRAPVVRERHRSSEASVIATTPATLAPTAARRDDTGKRTGVPDSKSVCEMTPSAPQASNNPTGSAARINAAGSPTASAMRADRGNPCRRANSDSDLRSNTMERPSE